MNLKEVMKEALAVDPHEVVKCGLDSFDPYAYFQWPTELAQKVAALPEEDQDTFGDFETDYLYALQMGDVDSLKMQYELE